ncbi:RodZ domain-containing protein [Thalassotalea agarivorans]|uniref:Cytoskeleton protein RodZ n=1 Tax=Thalassotalea agarivorans TaxID=349064 RepID=A0A1H9YDX9_THASX|nr:RodZ domain-containing protein [Thalassotalea agarivorans]SES67178.1 cytoskeleton protein RodZ [Thalassotalea agarivorans]
MSEELKIEELTEDIEIVGPGLLLKDAREAKGLTAKDIASKLNLRVALVEQIEAEQIDESLPPTYVRGFLRNYARLVGLLESDVIASYESTQVAAEQSAEMLSFSRVTEKQKQHNIVMWISYAVAAIVFGSSFVWWLQASNESSDVPVPAVVASTTEQPAEANEQTVDSAPSNNEQETLATSMPTTAVVENSEPAVEIEQAPVAADTSSAPQESTPVVIQLPQQEGVLPQDDPAILVSAVFDFAGDCWVNIFDANGKRLAWGIKKGGYSMRINGAAPLSVTLGKPELVAIDLDGQEVDMSQFGEGNIAKFTLPLTQAAVVE